MAAKPARFTPARQAKLTEAFRGGATMRIAAGVSRTPLRTLQQWLQRGRLELEEWAEIAELLPETEEPPEWSIHASFYVEVAEAIAERDLRWLSKIESGDTGEDSRGKPKDWQRYAWLLERTSPDEFALKEGVRRLELTGAGGGPIRHEGSTQLAAILKVLEGAGAIEERSVAQLGAGDDRPRDAVSAPGAVLAELAAGEPAAGGLSPS